MVIDEIMVVQKQYMQKHVLLSTCSVAKTSVRAVHGLHEPSARDEYKTVESI